MANLIKNYESTIAKIRGRLHPTTAFLTMFILDEQLQAGISGNMLEIGVLGGRYIALMSRYLTNDEKAFGLDPFYIDGTGIQQVVQALEGVQCNHNVEIIKTRSDKYSAEEYKKKWGPIRFFHIDGSHQCKDVIKDLAIADEVLQEDGILAFDDFFNPYWMGVTEALFRYFEQTPETSLQPIGYCRNKLFISRASHQEFYGSLFTRFVNEHPDKIVITGKTDRTSKILSHTIPVLF